MELIVLTEDERCLCGELLDAEHAAARPGCGYWTDTDYPAGSQSK